MAAQASPDPPLVDTATKVARVVSVVLHGSRMFAELIRQTHSPNSFAELIPVYHRDKFMCLEFT